MQIIVVEGGLIGIGFWVDVICDDSLVGVVCVFFLVVEFVGIDYVVLGLDYDGIIIVLFDGVELLVLIYELLCLGLMFDEVVSIMGENVICFFLVNLLQEMDE